MEKDKQDWAQQIGFERIGGHRTGMLDMQSTDRFGKESVEYETTELIRLWEYLISGCTAPTAAPPYVAA